VQRLTDWLQFNQWAAVDQVGNKFTRSSGSTGEM
jgi:hypothetical protein